MNSSPLRFDASRPSAVNRPWTLSRREFIATSALAGGGLLLGRQHVAAAERPENAAKSKKALIAITLDLEMSRNFPQWEDTHWDYEKGVLNEESKRYSVEAARRVKARGGLIHFFCVARVLEQENVDWLKEIVAAGHPVGNHTYDHVNVLATKPEDIQFRFKRAPWLIAGKTPAEVIRENILAANAALKTRIGIEPAGFRTPGGFPNGLDGRTDLQQMLLDLGFKWISAKSPGGLRVEAGKEPPPELFEAIVKTQTESQPYIYPTGLIEVPMSTLSDVGAFRGGRWKLDSFLKSVRLGVEWAIEHGAVFDLLTHPSVMYPSDPSFKVYDLICDLVQKAGERAAIVDLGDDCNPREAAARGLSRTQAIAVGQRNTRSIWRSGAATEGLERSLPTEHTDYTETRSSSVSSVCPVGHRFECLGRSFQPSCTPHDSKLWHSITKNPA